MDKCNGDRLLNKQSCSSHSFDVFHTRIQHQHCRKAYTRSTQVWWCPSCLSHAVNVDTANCPACSRPTCASRPNDRRSYLKFSLWRRHWSANKTDVKEWRTMLLVENVYAPYRETNSPPTFIPSLQHEAQTCRVSCYNLPATSEEWAISGRSTGPSNCDYGAMHTGG